MKYYELKEIIEDKKNDLFMDISNLFSVENYFII